MGRPLFSLAYTQTPVVRQAPEPTLDSPEKWAAWNKFDPDSDEFFESSIWEAFIDPNEVISREGEEEPIMVELGDGRSVLTMPIEGALQRGSPMAVGPDDPARMLVESYFTDPLNVRRMGSLSGGIREAGLTVPEYDPETLNMTSAYSYPLIPGHFYPAPGVDMPISHSPSAAADTSRGPQLRPRPEPIVGQSREPIIDHAPPTRSVEQHLRTSSFVESHSGLPPLVPSTPTPRTAVLSTASSSSPSVTSRLQSWSSHRPIPIQRSPSQHGGPLTNPGARMSLAHIAPTLSLVRDVAV